MRLDEDIWEKISTLIPKPKKGPVGQGRPPQPRKAVLEGILWVLKSGARWKDLPKDYPPYQSCHRIFQDWQTAGVYEQILSTLTADLERQGKLKSDLAFIDGSFVESKKGGQKSDMDTRGMARH